MSHTPTDSGISALVADARNCAAKPDTMLQLWRSKLTSCAELIESQAAELATLRAGRDALETQERTRIIAALRAEAEVIPCDEDAMIVADCADLIECNFSYEDCEKLKEARAANDRALKGGA